MYIYICICYHENNVPSWLSPQWLCGNSCTWAHDILFFSLIKKFLFVNTINKSYIHIKESSM